MSSVNITINGKQYRVACEPGQEQRLSQLAADFDERIASMRSRFGEVGDARLTVMAAMMLGDELFDAKAKIARLEAEINALNAARAGASDRSEPHRSRRRLGARCRGRQDRAHDARAEPPGGRQHGGRLGSLENSLRRPRGWLGARWITHRFPRSAGEFHARPRCASCFWIFCPRSFSSRSMR